MSRRRIFGATVWDLTSSFFEAQAEYHQVYILYETRVLAHAEERSVDRRRLRLDASEVSKLLDFERLGHLRSGPLQRTRQVSHALFRSKGHTHKLDRYIGEIYHELSILREEQYKVSTFAEEYRLDNELAEYESLLDEVHEEFPRRVGHIHELFRKAQHTLEGVLRGHCRDPIYLRSLHLFGDETLRDAYPEGVITHAWRVFDKGPAEAFLLAGRSFARKGFKQDALAALDRAVQAALSPPPPGYPATPEDLKELDIEARKLRDFVASRSPADLVQAPLPPLMPALEMQGASPAWAEHKDERIGIN